MAKRTGKPPGRPQLYSPEVAERICELIATTNRGLGYILRLNPELPRMSIVLKWLGDADKAAFLESYRRAREAQADLIFDECLEIADDSSSDGERADNGKESQNATEQVARSKLRVDTRLRMAGKLAPKKYGDKVEFSGGLEIKGSARDMSEAELLKVAMAGSE